MTYYLFEGGEFGGACAALCEAAGFRRTADIYSAAFALAPCLTRKVSRFEWSAPGHGTLIFHPSLLPYHRGPDAIRWVAGLGERASGVTWFWADEGLDTGAICEQEPVVLKVGESPGRAYRSRYQPAGLRALSRALEGIRAGEPRRVPQEAALGSYESFYAHRIGAPSP